MLSRNFIENGLIVLIQPGKKRFFNPFFLLDIALRAYLRQRILSHWRKMAALAISLLKMTSKWKKYTFTYPK